MHYILHECHKYEILQYPNFSYGTRHYNPTYIRNFMNIYNDFNTKTKVDCTWCIRASCHWTRNAKIRIMRHFGKTLCVRTRKWIFRRSWRWRFYSCCFRRCGHQLMILPSSISSHKLQSLHKPLWIRSHHTCRSYH